MSDMSWRKENETECQVVEETQPVHVGDSLYYALYGHASRLKLHGLVVGTNGSFSDNPHVSDSDDDYVIDSGSHGFDSKVGQTDDEYLSMEAQCKDDSVDDSMCEDGQCIPEKFSE